MVVGITNTSDSVASDNESSSTAKTKNLTPRRIHQFNSALFSFEQLDYIHNTDDHYGGFRALCRYQ